MDSLAGHEEQNDDLMFEKLILKNFQPHKKLVIRFDERVTSIVGPTDTGKSAIVRALRWLCLNKTGSKRLISWWAKSTTATLHVDGHVVKRSKGKENTYVLDGQVFKAFGTSVPEPILDILNVAEETFQRQVDPPLWLAASPAQVGRELNRIVNLDVIDLTLSNVSRAKREAQAKVKSLKEVRTKVKHDVEELEWVDQCQQDFLRLEKLETRREELELDIALLTRIINKVVLHRNNRKHARNCLVPGCRAVELGEHAQRVRGQKDALVKLLSQITTTKSRLSEYKGKLQTSQTKLANVKECPVCRQPLT